MSTLIASAVPSVPVPLAEGDEMPVGAAGPLTRTDFVRYAGASGDFHPLHHDEGYAREAGFPGVFGMGLFHGGILGDHLAHWVGPDNLRSFAIRFTGQVWPGDMLTFTGKVDGIEEAASGRRARLSLAVRRQTGDTAATAVAVAVVAG